MFARFRYVSKNNTYVVSIEPNNQSEVYAQVIFKVRAFAIVSVSFVNKSLTPSTFEHIIQSFSSFKPRFLYDMSFSSHPGFFFDSDFEFR